MDTNAVKVTIWGMTAGYLSWDKQSGVASFEYDPSFVKQDLDIFPLTMSIHSPRSQSRIPWTGDSDKRYHGLPPAIADSLPDKWGNSLFRSWLRDNNILNRKITPLDHLSFIGSRAMGALAFEPAQPLGDNTSFSVDVQRLYEFSKQVLSTQASVVLSKENSILWQDLIKVSSSPGGKRPKAIVAINRETGGVISGQGSIPEDYDHFILKYDDDSVYPYAKLEYIYYRMAATAGITVMPSELRNYGNVTHFLTRRFDRCGNERIHTQTLAAMSPFSSSYNDIFAVIRQLNLPFEDSRQQFLRMVFNVVARNVDDHSKNFAFCMTHSGQWRLSPAYDLTFSIDLAAPSYVNRHSLTVNGKVEDITRADLIADAERNDIKDSNAMIENVINACMQFERFAAELDINQSLTGKIKESFNMLK